MGIGTEKKVEEHESKKKKNMGERSKTVRELKGRHPDRSGE